MGQSNPTLRSARFGVFEVDLRAGELRKHGLKIRLQEKPFQLLATLLERPGDVVLREELRAKLWPGDTFVDFDHSINIAINKLREALGDSPENPRFVETLAKRGYRFIASVEPIQAESMAQRTTTARAIAQPATILVPPSGPSSPAPHVAPDIAPTVSVPGGTAESHSTTSKAHGRVIERVWGFRAGLVGLVVALALAVYLIWPPSPPKSGKIMLAVLPFENLSGDPQQGFFTDGMTEEIIAQLGALQPEHLGVIARNTVMQYKGSKKDPQRIGDELGVQYVLEGSVRRVDETVRITAQLIQCSDRTHLWAKTYDGDLRNIFNLQSDVAQAIAEAIQLKLTPEQQARLASARAVDPEAYEAYLRGREYWNQRGAGGLGKAIQYFEQATKKDPGYASAYTGLADSYSLLGSIEIGYHVLPPKQAMLKAKDYAQRAVQIDGALAEAHTSLAYTKFAYDWNWPDAEDEFKRAIQLKPGYATAHQWYALYLAAMGRLDEASAEIKYALEIDPLSLPINVTAAEILIFARQYDQAIAQCRKTFEVDAGNIAGHYYLGRAYEEKKMYAGAIAEFTKGKDISSGDPGLIMALGHAYAVSGNRAKAQQMIRELTDLSKQRYVPALFIAAIYTGLGNKNQAFEWIEKSYGERSDYLLYLDREPAADTLRSDPRFQDLLRRIGLPRIHALAILPFENRTGDPQQEYFADGMTDELITNMGKIGALRVISLTSVMQFKGSRKPVPQVARELHVDAVVKGAVQRVGQNVRITAQLIEASASRELGSHTYDRDMRNVRALQGELARAIASEIMVKLTTQEQARLTDTRSVDPDAYEAYLKGRYYWGKRGGEGLAKAIQYFEQAIGKEPKYALAYSGLADCYALLGSIGIGYDVLPPKIAKPKAKDAALKALKIDDTLAEAHTSLAYTKFAYDWDWPSAEREFKRAIELNPTYATAHQWYALFLAAMGRIDEGLAEIEQARKLDPLSLPINVTAAEVFVLARKYDRAIEQCRKTFELDPNSIAAHYYLGQAYEQKGMYADALAEFQKGEVLPGGGPVMIMALGHAYAVSGKKVEAHKDIDKLVALSVQRYVPALYVAGIYAGLGDKDQVFRWIDKAYDERSDYLLYLEIEPMADSLHSDPRFTSLLRRIGLPHIPT